MGMEAFGKKTLRATLACLLMIIVPMAGLVGTVTASTTPTHVISDQTWTAAGNPYLIDDMLVIMPDKTLTIEEGVVIEFSPSGSLDVRGDLNVFGTAADPVVFTIDSANATSSQRWGGIQLQTDDFDVDLVMRNAVVSHANSGVRIACCSQGSILIEDSTFLKNGVAISGYAGYAAIINNVTFMYNTAGVDSADKDITHSTFMHNMWGIRSAERIDVSYSLFEDNDIAAYGGRGLLHCNIIQDNRIGVQAFYEGWALEDNLIQDNYEVGVILGQYGSSVPHAWGNSFLNNGMGANTVADISVQNTNNINIDFEQNWWGTTNSSVIDAAIHDFFDASQLGIVDYTPTLTADSTAASCQGGGTATNNTGTIDLNDTDQNDDGTGITPDTNDTEPDDDGTGITPDTNETEPLDNNTGTEDPHSNGTDPSSNGTDPIGDDDGTVGNDTDPTPRISMWPGKVNQHNENGVWMTDPDGVSGGWPSTTYSTDYGDRKLEYCQKFWPNTVSIQLRDFRETITFWTRGNTDSHVSTRDVYECVLGDGNGTQEGAEYEQRLADLQERERQAWEDAMNECDRAWDELDEQYMMMVESLEEQMMDELEMEQFGLDDSLSIRYEEYDVQYTELLIQLSEAEDEDEAALIIQEIQSLRESEQQVIEWVYEVYYARIAELVEQYEAMIDALDDEAFESLRHDVEADCEVLFEELEEQFAAEYDALDSSTGDDYSCSNEESCTDGDEDAIRHAIGRTVPGFTGLLSVAAMSGAVLLVGRRRLL